MTGSWRRRWPLLRAWTARAAATAGLVGGAWLLAAGPADAAPQPDVVPAVRVEVAEPAISPPAARPAIARPDPVEITAPSVPEPVHEDVPTDAVQLGVADLAADITSGVRAELEPVADPAEHDRVEPDVAHLLPDPGSTGSVATTAAPPADVAAPRAQALERVEPAPSALTEAPDAAQHLSAPAPEPQHQAAPTPAPVERGGTAPHQGPPVAPPAVVTASAAPSGSGHGLRWMHAVLPTRAHLPGPVRAVGGHVETVTSRGIALIEPSTSPD